MKKISLFLVLFLTLLLTYGAISNVSVKQPGNSNGLVAWYPFNSNANDTTGNGNNPTYIGTGVTLTSDRFGNADKAYYFDGAVGSYIRIPADKFPATNRTISFWFYADDPAVYRTPFSYGGNGCDASCFLMILNQSGTGTYTKTGHCNAERLIVPYSTPPVNSWKQWVITINGSVQKIYIDGILQTPSFDANFSTPTYVAGRYVLLGAMVNTDGNSVYQDGVWNFKGKMDEFRIYNNAMTDAQVQQLYTGESTGLVAYYPFNGNANDESGNGHDGTVYGGILTEDRNNSSNSAYTFPNLHNQIVLSNTADLNLQGGFTLNAWIKYKNINSRIVGKHNCWTSNGFLLGIEDGQFTLWISDGGWNIIKTNETYQEDKWYMITAVYDSVNKSGLLYVGGKLKSSGTAVYSNFNAANLTISEASGSCPSGNMPGAIDEVKIYTHPLSAEEIQFEYNTSFTGLVAYYPFNGNADDASGNKNNGVVNNAVLTNDRYGIADKAYAFNGIDGYIEGTDPGNNLPTGNSSRTFAAWVKNYTYEQWGSNIYHYGTKEAAPTNFHFLITNVLGLGNGYGYGVTYGKTNIIDSTWHFIAGVYEGSSTQKAKVFVDGKPDNEGVLSTEPNTVLGSNWRIGRFMEGSTNFNGNIDDLRVCNTALTDQEIKDLYLAETTAPALQNPANKSSVTTLTPEMLWSSPLANGEFRLQLSSDSLFGTILHELVTTDQKTQLPDAMLTEGQNYFWRIRTTLNGETGPWSSVWSFDFVNTSLEKPIRDNVSLRLSPNPADAATKIIYSLPETGINGAPVTVEIVNSIGKCTKKLTEKNVQGRYNELEVETSSLQSGVYYCRLKAGSISIVRKLVIIH